MFCAMDTYLFLCIHKKGKAIPLQAGTGPEVCRNFRLQISRQSAHEGAKVSPTHRPSLPPGNIPATYFCDRLSRPQDHSAAGRIMSMKNSSEFIGNRTRNFPACSAVPQPTAPQRVTELITSTYSSCA
jgi:hypothetical protein